MSSAGGSRRLERLWYGDSPLAMLLLPLAWAFRAATAARRALYRRGWLRESRVGAPVIVVGNITVGGTGKTPVVEWLVRRLSAAGFRPGIASRGYGGRPRHEPVAVVPGSDAAEVGDEPLLLARRTGALVAVCTHRVAAATALVAAGADVIVADDGLQHYALARDLEIAVLDGSRRLGNGRLLPAGPLREPAGRLAGCDLILVNGDAAGPGEFGFTLRGGEAVALSGGDRRDLDDFSGRKVWAVAGIGNPERFCAELRQRGIQPVAADIPDHGRADLFGLRQTGPWPILMTEKDAVKYPGTNVPDAWYVPVEVQMEPGIELAVMARVSEAIRAAVAAEGMRRAGS